MFPIGSLCSAGFYLFGVDNGAVSAVGGPGEEVGAVAEAGAAAKLHPSLFTGWVQKLKTVEFREVCFGSVIQNCEKLLAGNFELVKTPNRVHAVQFRNLIWEISGLQRLCFYILHSTIYNNLNNAHQPEQPRFFFANLQCAGLCKKLA